MEKSSDEKRAVAQAWQAAWTPKAKQRIAGRGANVSLASTVRPDGRMNMAPKPPKHVGKIPMPSRRSASEQAFGRGGAVKANVKRDAGRIGI